MQGQRKKDGNKVGLVLVLVGLSVGEGRKWMMERNLIIQHTMIGLWNPLSIRPKIETCDLSVMSVSTLLVSWHGGWSRVQFCWACLGPTNIWKGSNFNHASHRRFVSDGCHYQFWILNIIIAGTFHWILLSWNIRFWVGLCSGKPSYEKLAQC